MDKSTWFQKSKEERIAYLHEFLTKLVEITKLEKNCRRKRISEPPHPDKWLIEKKIQLVIEWEKEEHE